MLAIVVGIVIVAATTLLAATIAAAPAPPLRPQAAGGGGWFCTPRRATLGHAVLTTVACLISVVAGILDALPNRSLDPLLSTCVGVAQGIDGYFSWSRYATVYPGWAPSCLQTVGLHAYVLLLLVSPFLSTWISWSPAFTEDLDSGETPAIVTMGLMAWYFVSIPARILYDIVLGCSVLTRIHELRLAVRLGLDFITDCCGGGGDAAAARSSTYFHRSTPQTARGDREWVGRR